MTMTHRDMIQSETPSVAPLTYDILGMDHTIIWDAKMIRKSNATGQFCGNLCQIVLDPTILIDHQRTTLVHELIEAVNYHLCLGLEHDKISQLEVGLFQIFNRNPAILQFIKDGTGIER